MHFPGAGVGGHCLPKYTWLLMYGYDKYANLKIHYPFSILAYSRHLNDWMPIDMVDLLELALKECNEEIKNSTIAVLGYAFLENSYDSRNTPTIPFLKELEKRGAKFKIHDPYIKDSEEGYKLETDLTTVLKDCDALVIMTKHDVYKAIALKELGKSLRTKIIIDGRNLFDPLRFTSAGFVFKGVGKGRQVDA